MIFEYPDVLWLLLVFPILFLILSFWEWGTKKDIINIFPVDIRYCKIKQVEKYIIAGVFISLLIISLALPKIELHPSASDQKEGEIILLVDVSGSMGAKKNLDSNDRLERIKPILYDVVRNMQELERVKISLCCFTNVARSLVPLVGVGDYSYIIESVSKVLDIYSVPGSGTSIGQPILNVVDKFSIGDHAKLIVILSDGEIYESGLTETTEKERKLIDQAIAKTALKSIKVISIGIGEREGAKIPIYNIYGEFTGKYAIRKVNVDYISYFKDHLLKEVAYRSGGEFFFEEDLNGLINCIKESLDPVSAEEVSKDDKIFQPVANLFVLPALLIWVFFVRRHLLV